MAELAGDFLTCCGEERGPRGEKTWAPVREKGVETGGEAPWGCGVRPCWEGPVLPGVGVAMVVLGAVFRGGVGRRRNAVTKESRFRG